jgi:hypothetical protein
MTGETEAMAVGSLIFTIVLSAMLFLGFCVLISTRKSKEYRKVITDMYVAAKTKLLAKEDGLDLANEYEDFKKWSKKERMNNSCMDLDTAIEEELKQRVAEPKKK